MTGSKSERAGGAKLVPISCDSKLSQVVRVPHGRDTFRSYALVQRGPRVAATYTSIDKTCPTSCAFRGNGCMAESGFTRVAGQQLDLDAIGLSGEDVARAEARLLDEAFPRGRIPQDGARGGRDLRLHVGGDVPSYRGALELSAAAMRWRARGGGAVWTYTHRWLEVPRSAWSSISVLASVETPGQALAAVARGYVPALVVPAFPNGVKAFGLGELAGAQRAPRVRLGRRSAARALSFIPCPAEVAPERMNCAKCRLCLDDGALRQRNLGIAFAVHGRAKDRAAAALMGDARAA